MQEVVQEVGAAGSSGGLVEEYALYVGCGSMCWDAKQHKPAAYCSWGCLMTACHWKNLAGDDCMGFLQTVQNCYRNVAC